MANFTLIWCRMGYGPLETVSFKKFGNIISPCGIYLARFLQNYQDFMGDSRWFYIFNFVRFGQQIVNFQGLTSEMRLKNFHGLLAAKLLIISEKVRKVQK